MTNNDERDYAEEAANAAELRAEVAEVYSVDLDALRVLVDRVNREPWNVEGTAAGQLLRQAPTAIPALIAEVTGLRAEVKRLKEEIDTRIEWARQVMVSRDSNSDGLIAHIDELRARVAELEAAQAHQVAPCVVDGRDHLIWSREHNAWWAWARRGYVTDIDSAGRYTRAEAEEICANEHWGNPRHPNEVAIHVGAIDRLAGHPDRARIARHLIEDATGDAIAARYTATT